VASTTRRARRPLDVWPGYVDALAALLILVIFVLLLFSFAQFLLSQLLDAQETELDVMYQRVVELTDLLGRATSGLSGGERQRVALGRSLFAAPRVLLLDEPLAALDRGRRGPVLAFLRRLQERFEIPTLHVTHDLP